MQLFCCFVFSLLCCPHLISCEVSLVCNKMQYPWPVKEPKDCCQKCQPGTHLDRRSKSTCDIECSSCVGDRFTDSYNVLMDCEACKLCNEPNQEYESRCSPTRDSVCRCRTGYGCSDPSCTKCVPVATTTTTTTTPSPTPTPKVSASTTTTRPALTTTPHYSTKPIRETVWFLVIIALLCIGIAVAVLAKIKLFLQWIRFNYGSIFDKKIQVNTEDDDVSKPVQEVCGKCDQPIEICVKD